MKTLDYLYHFPYYWKNYIQTNDLKYLTIYFKFLYNTRQFDILCFLYDCLVNENIISKINLDWNALNSVPVDESSIHWYRLNIY